VQEKAKVSQDDASDLEGDEAAALIDEFNRRYMVVNEAGKAFVFEEVCDYALKRQRYQRMNFDDFCRLYSNRLVAVGIDKKGAPLLEPAGRYWLGHPKRRQFIGGVIFDPSNGAHSEDMLNLWRGFALEPRAGSWARLKHHMLNNVCNDNEEHYDFLLKWMARMFQFPGEQGEVAIVLCGIEGTGKGTVAKALKRLLGQHGLAISNTRHLTGNFNSHMRDVIFLFADEAFFAGDKAHVGVLKALVTEPTLTIEGKYQNAVEAPNYLHLMLASNEAWVVPASLEARRFFVLNVSDRCANNHDYFAAIHEELDNGGYEAMLHELLNLDLTGFNHRRAPRTVGLQEQQKLSLPVAEKWWIDVLMRGYVWRSRLGLENFFSEWHECVSTELLFDAYVAYAKEARERHPLSREALGKYLVRMGCSPCRLSDAVVGEHLVETSSGFGTSRVPKTLIQPRARGYQIGTLNEARAKFQKATKLTSIDWADEDDAPEDVF
jgi:hypothetical protein